MNIEILNVIGFELNRFESLNVNIYTFLCKIYLKTKIFFHKNYVKFSLIVNSKKKINVILHI